MTATDSSPLKISAEAHRRIRLAAAMADCTMGELLDRAVTEFLEKNRDEIEAGMAYAREVLCVN